MPHNRFYTTDPLKESVRLTEKEHHHLTHVMRAKENDTVEVVNGKWQLAIGRIIAIKKRETIVAIDKMREATPPDALLTIAVPILQLTSMELVIEKCTEIGAHSFWIYPAEKSEKKSLSENQIRRLHQFTISAMKQCGRLDLPTLEVYTSFLELPNHDMPIYFGDLSPDAEKWKKEKRSCVFCSGPEKGFAAAEIQHLWQKGKGVVLGPHTLRAETAPLVFSSLFFAP